MPVRPAQQGRTWQESMGWPHLVQSQKITALDWLSSSGGSLAKLTLTLFGNSGDTVPAIAKAGCWRPNNSLKGLVFGQPHSSGVECLFAASGSCTKAEWLARCQGRLANRSRHCIVLHVRHLSRRAGVQLCSDQPEPGAPLFSS